MSTTEEQLLAGRRRDTTDCGETALETEMKDLAEKLEKLGCYPGNASGGNFTELMVCSDDGEERELTEEEYESLGIDKSTFIGTIEEHPEGSDRGGYVPTITVGDESSYYYEPCGEWS